MFFCFIKLTTSDVYDILEVGDFFKAVVYLQPHHSGLVSDEDSNPE